MVGVEALVVVVVFSLWFFFWGERAGGQDLMSVVGGSDAGAWESAGFA